MKGRKVEKQELPAGGGGYQTTQPDRTRPNLLKSRAGRAARALVRPGEGRPLPLEQFVEAQERAGLGAHGLSGLRDLADVTAEVMTTDVQLQAAEAKSKDANARQASAEKRATPAGTIRQQPVLELPAAGHATRRRRLINPVLEWFALAGIAGGEAALTYLAAKVTTLGPLVRQLFTLAVGIASVFTALVAARCLDQLGRGPDGQDDTRRRRLLDIGVGVLALGSGGAVALAVARMREAFLRAVYDGMAQQTTALVIDQRYLPWLLVLGVALLGLGTAVAYAAIPDNPGVVGRWGKALLGYFLAARLRRRAQQRQQAELEALRQTATAAAAEVVEHRAALYRLASMVLAAEEHALTSRQVQAAAGDAAKHDAAEHLLEAGYRRRRGVPEKLKDWWHGRAPEVPEALPAITSLSSAEPAWAAQVARITSPAKRVLIRRGVLTDEDVTPSLVLPEAQPERLKGDVKRVKDNPASANGKPPHPPSITARKGDAP